MDESHAADRTALAWRRTSLGVVTGAAVVVRLQLPWLDPVLLLAGVAVLALGFGAALAWASRGTDRDGRSAALVVLATVALASCELVLLAG